MEINYETDIDLLINATIEIGNSIQGHSIPQDIPFLYFAEGLGQKILNHTLTARYLFHGYQLGSGGNLFASKIDYSSIAILTRAALETYLTMNYVFVAEGNSEQRQFRFLCWDLAGYLERSDFQAKDDTHVTLKQSEAVAIEKLKRELHENDIFKSLTPKQKEKVLTGQWRLNYSWNDLALKAGFSKDYFRQQYKFLCGYAHSSRLSVIQIQQNVTIEQQREMAIASIGTLMVVLAKHMHDYIELMPQLNSVKQDMKKYPIIHFWKTIGETILKPETTDNAN